MYICGIAGNIALSLCGIPLLVSTIKKLSHTSYLFLAVWGAGELLALICALYNRIFWFISANYVVSLLLITLIWVFQRRNKNTAL